MPTPSQNIQTRVNNLTAELAASRNTDTLEYRMGLWDELKCLRQLLDKGSLEDLDGSSSDSAAFEELQRGIT